MRIARLAVLLLPCIAFAQAPADVKPSSSTPDLSGVWNIKGSPATRYLSWGFTKEEPPMTPWAEERFKAAKPSFGPRAVEDSNDPVNPTMLSAVGCFPPGMPRLYLQPFPMEIIQVPGRVIMLFEFSHFIRQIYTDGRKHNTDLGPTWLGDAIGQWDGDTLVVERIRRVDEKTLTDDISIEDPKAYTKPWGGQITFQLRPTWNITEMVCEDNVNFDQFLKNEAKPKK